MAGERIDSAGEARHLQHKYHQAHTHHATHYEAGAAPVHGVSGTGMDGVQVDLAKLAEAEGKLAGLHETLMAHLRDATRLTDDLQDGTSPVAGPMREAFFDRAGTEVGVQAFLQGYLDELFNVRGAILQTLAGYRSVDESAVAMLHEQTADLHPGTEV